MIEDEKLIETMNSGSLYVPYDKKLFLEQLKRLAWNNQYNKIRSSPWGFLRRTRKLKKMFAEIGEGCYLEPPLHSSWGCSHVHFGKGIYANFNLTLVDDAAITVGDGTLFGPNVTICTAGHPLHPEVRGAGIQYNLPVRIGQHCWIGAGVIILPGVAIGEGSVIGAGSVVTKDVPPMVVAAGVPCQVLHPITEADRYVYNHGKPVPKEFQNLEK
jgi:galactoside O-acetyltransferase